MKYYFSLLLVLYVSTSFGQIKSGKIIYHVKSTSADVSEKSTPNSFKQTKQLIENEFPKLEFILEFNKYRSNFGAKKELPLDDDDYYKKMALIVTRGTRLFYANSLNKILTEKISFLGEDLIIKTKYKDLNWVLVNETKKIGEYICYKAFLDLEIESISKEEKTNYRYTAWYCPELSFNYGPFESVNLPGLVLEFSNEKLICFAHTITLSKEEISIEDPSKGKLITQEEFNQIGQKAYENRN